MKRGAILIAHNTEEIDYYKMAVCSAKRINQFLDLPVTIITDSDSVTPQNYTFDNVVLSEPNKTNYRKKSAWLNKDRYKVYDFSPYDETIVLDTDYLINGQQLLKLFSLPNEFLCHKNIRWIMENDEQEFLNPNTIQSLWATVMKFTRSSRVKHIFDMIEMVQMNYSHYSNLYKFAPYVYRNDYALTIALKTVNGHIEQLEDYIPWKLLHVSKNIKVIRESDDSYLFMNYTNKRPEYIKVNGLDFHMLDKKNYMDLFE